MQRLSDLDYLKLGRFSKFLYKLKCFFAGIPIWFLNLFKKIGGGIWSFIKGIGNFFKDIGVTFVKGSWFTKVSYFIMGFGSMLRGQFFRGLIFFIFEGVFIFYMIFTGGYWLGKLDNLGDVGPHKEYNVVLDVDVLVPGENSFKILLYGVVTVLFILAFIYTWRLNIKQNKMIDEIIASGKKVKSGKDDLKSLVDDQFHKTLLALPITGVTLFTILPILFMILIAFTNFDAHHDGYNNLFTWVGMTNFNELFNFGDTNANLSYTFGEILSWTLIWAFFATFTNYFLGMFVAMMINKKGIKFKKFWRGILVLTIAIPQFVSLLYVSKLFAANGLINGLLLDLGILSEPFKFWDGATSSRILVILINIWIGIPYLMLIATGILMNIPEDLYESSKIDGASGYQQYVRITLPYMLFVTGPYLLTSFTGNINNFNVIYLLTNGKPDNPALLTSGGAANDTDLLITWLFRITTGTENNYKLAAVIGIMIFIVVAIISLIVYSILPSNRNEDDYS